MRRRVAVLFGFAFAVSPGVSVKAQSPSFALTFNAPSSAPEVAGGSPASYSAVGQLTTTGLAPTDSGAQAWSISMGADGGGTIIDATTTGTIVDDLFMEGYLRVEVTSGAGNEGAVSAVVLAFMLPVTLPPTGRSTSSS